MFSMASHCPRNRKGALEASQDLAIAPSGASASKSPEKFAATLVAKMTIHWNSLELGVRHFQTNPEGPGRPQIISSFMFIRNPLSAPPQAGFLALSATTLLCPLFMYIYIHIELMINMIIPMRQRKSTPGPKVGWHRGSRVSHA